MAHEEAYSFRSLHIKQFPKVQKTENAEEKHWGKYQFPLTCKEHSVVTSVNFSPSEPHDYVVTSGSKVNVYSCSTNLVKKSISRFHESAYSAQFRRDGKLLVAGEEQGNVKVFDIGSRDILRQCKEHKKAVHYTCFSLDGLKLMSCSDDTTVRCWDLATTDNSLLTMRGHADYVRVGGISRVDPSLWFTGSYDHLVKLWDIRSGDCVQSMCHGSPLEFLLVHPSGGICFTAGNNVVKVWDILAGGRLLASFSNHQKTITSLCFDGSYRRLLSAGLDRQVKVYSMEDYHVKSSMSYPAAILSMAISPTDSHLVVGMANKLLSIKCMKNKHDDDDDLVPSAVKRARIGNYKYFMRGMHYKPTGDVLTVENKRRKHLKPYENYLKKFKYHDALDSVLKSNAKNRGVLVYSLLQELSRRGGLRTAVSGRSEEQLLPLLQYLCKFMLNPRYSNFLSDVLLMVLDIYGPAVDKGSGSEAVLKTVKVKVDLELRLQRKSLELLGAIDMIMAASTIN